MLALGIVSANIRTVATSESVSSRDNSAYAAQDDSIGITTLRLSIRTAPDSSSRQLGITQVGDTLIYLSTEIHNGYVHVATSSADTGWVLARGVERLSPTTAISVARRVGTDTNGRVSSSSVANSSASLMLGGIESWSKPLPVQLTTGPCDAEGRGRNGPATDPTTDLRKNRIDIPNEYHSVTLSEILALPWAGLPRRRSKLQTADSETVARYEGPPVSVEGYFEGAHEEGEETTNCELTTHDWHDWHIWLVETQQQATQQDRTHAIVVEATPRIRALPTPWALSELQTIVRQRERVRVSGWLMWDPDHPDQVGKTRGTTWEIHPITRIEVARNGVWQVLPAAH